MSGPDIRIVYFEGSKELKTVWRCHVPRIGDTVQFWADLYTVAAVNWMEVPDEPVHARILLQRK